MHTFQTEQQAEERRRTFLGSPYVEWNLLAILVLSSKAKFLIMPLSQDLIAACRTLIAGPIEVDDIATPALRLGRISG